MEGLILFLLKNLVFSFLVFMFILESESGFTILFCLNREIDRLTSCFSRSWRWRWNVFGNDEERRAFFTCFQEKENVCVCAGEWEKHGRYFFFFAFWGRKGCEGHMFCDFFVCFWWFIGDRVFWYVYGVLTCMRKEEEKCFWYGAFSYS